MYNFFQKKAKQTLFIQLKCIIIMTYDRVVTGTVAEPDRACDRDQYRACFDTILTSEIYGLISEL